MAITVLHEKDAVPVSDTAAPDREASYTEPASHLATDDPLKVEVDVSEQEPELEDIFKPLPPLPGVPAESDPLTFRAVITGIVLGSLVNAANVYLGLKTGFTFGASMFGAIFGYGFVKLLSTIFAGMPILGTPFGPQENSIIQAAAAGAGGLSGLSVAALPAMYHLNLLSDDPRDDYGHYMTLTFIGSFFGLFFAAPLRKFFIMGTCHCGISDLLLRPFFWYSAGPGSTHKIMVAVAMSDLLFHLGANHVPVIL
ncbi:hypothetical protein DL766_001141 [Monosporascus sp. MC13-8B]|nr:hypothetical protein DL766_001141 [Monosporascus sp. MC13-8B]